MVEVAQVVVIHVASGHHFLRRESLRHRGDKGRLGVWLIELRSSHLHKFRRTPSGGSELIAGDVELRRC